MSTKAPAAKTAAKVPATKAAAKVPAKAPVKAAAKPAAPAAPVVASKGKRKLVRDSFTMPHADYELIAQLKLRTLKSERSTKKSELLRAGLQALSAMNDKQLLALLDGLSPIKAGRPKSD